MKSLAIKSLMLCVSLVTATAWADGRDGRIGERDGKIGDRDGRVGERDGRVGDGRITNPDGRVGNGERDGRVTNPDGRVTYPDGRDGRDGHGRGGWDRDGRGGRWDHGRDHWDRDRWDRDGRDGRWGRPYPPPYPYPRPAPPPPPYYPPQYPPQYPPAPNYPPAPYPGEYVQRTIIINRMMQNERLDLCQYLGAQLADFNGTTLEAISVNTAGNYNGGTLELFVNGARHDVKPAYPQSLLRTQGPVYLGFRGDRVEVGVTWSFVTTVIINARRAY